MTRIDFYHDAPDKFGIAVRLAQKAFAQRLPLLIYAPDENVAGQIDRQLWTFHPLSFVPHCRSDSPLAAETPVLIARDLGAPCRASILINLGRDLPPDFSHFERVIEIVDRSEEDKGPARQRFKQYRDLGYDIERHDLSTH